ncbi:MAG: hypothetical protein AAGJ38_00320 [Planctomycetota bacterium]
MNIKQIQHAKIRATLKLIVELLVKSEFNQLEVISNGVRLKSEHISSAIASYGRKLDAPSEDDYRMVDIVAIKGAEHPKYSIRIRLFTEEEGRSDLEIQATFIDDNVDSPYMRIELDDILVA